MHSPEDRDQLTIEQFFLELLTSEEFRERPLKVRTTLQDVFKWLPAHTREFSILEIDASFARRLQERGTRERGYKFGNLALTFVQLLVARAVEQNLLAINRVRNVSKSRPSASPKQTARRRIKPIRSRATHPEALPKKADSNG
jgi:hypothetical protein